MSGNIANAMLAENATEEEILSTVLVLLAVGTATLGVVLILAGHFRLAEYVLLHEKVWFLLMLYIWIREITLET